jgi:hypothetical protein
MAPAAANAESAKGRIGETYKRGRWASRAVTFHPFVQVSRKSLYLLWLVPPMPL